MKLSVNRNIVWCDLFVHRLSELGVRYACISPGSRSTSLTLALVSNKKIKTFVIVDERSSAFFALGLAKKSKSPVAVVTTSGTAVAELYPAIIEAFYKHIPLIICTADRPSSLYDKGANQTINQRNIYKNHIRFYAGSGLPDLNNLGSIKKMAEDAIMHSCFLNKGPVHINLPFEKPFEPDNCTDKIEINKIEKVFSRSSFKFDEPKSQQINFKSLEEKLHRTVRGLILVSLNKYDKEFPGQLDRFSKLVGYPVYIDGSSSLRFGVRNKENHIDNLTAIIRAKNFQKYFDPDLIIQFGAAPTSNVLLEFFKNSKADKILVNEYGDRKDPSGTAKTILAIEPGKFFESIIQTAKGRKNRDSCWLIDFNVMNNHSEKLKSNFVEKAKFPFEGRIASELIEALPENSNLMISNSLPIRDFDFFTTSSRKKINIFTNRGASGIDGINSTALGIAKASNQHTYLLVGDLAFYHDLSSLHNAVKYKIPLTVILINNNGGGIFESLPISKYKKYFTENFTTPLELDLSKLVKAYGCRYFRIKSWNEFSKRLIAERQSKSLAVLEIQTDAKRSKVQRENYWKNAANKIESYINEIKG